MVRTRRSADCILFCLGRPWRGWGSRHAVKSAQQRRRQGEERSLLNHFSGSSTNNCRTAPQPQACGAPILVTQERRPHLPPRPKPTGDGRSGMAAQLDLCWGEDEICGYLPSGPTRPNQTPASACARMSGKRCVLPPGHWGRGGMGGMGGYEAAKRAATTEGEDPATTYVLDVIGSYGPIPITSTSFKVEGTPFLLPVSIRIQHHTRRTRRPHAR